MNIKRVIASILIVAFVLTMVIWVIVNIHPRPSPPEKWSSVTVLEGVRHLKREANSWRGSHGGNSPPSISILVREKQWWSHWLSSDGFYVSESGMQVVDSYSGEQIEPLPLDSIGRMGFRVSGMGSVGCQTVTRWMLNIDPEQLGFKEWYSEISVNGKTFSLARKANESFVNSPNFHEYLARLCQTKSGGNALEWRGL